MRDKIGWYAARLAAMSPPEIVHRLVEYRRKRELAAMTDGWAAFTDVPVLDLSTLAELKSRLAQAGPSSVNEILTQARFLGMDRADLFQDCSAPSPQAWFLDPVSGKHWPGADASARAVNVRATSATPSAERPFGDVKYVWEPNRLQILHPLATLVAGGGDESQKAADIGLAIISSWMEANPPYRGVNWTSGIELALRLVSLTLFVAALGEDGCNQKVKARLSAFVHAHARMLRTLPSLYSSANNHRVAEGLGLFLAGVLCPQLANDGAEGRDILESETLLQIYSDGVGGEQSPSYQAFTMELVGFGALTGALTGAPFSAATIARLEAGADFLCALQTRDGHVPSIGDDDEGRAILSPHVDEPFYVASVANMISGLSGRSQHAGAQPFYLREKLARCMVKGMTQPDGIRRFDVGGYDVVRTHISGRPVHLTFDRGGLGYLTLAGHGHADALAIWLSIDDRPVFIDAGTWLYHSGEGKRSALRRSQIHNTLSLKDMSQSEPSSAFSWANKALAKAVTPDPALASTEALFAFAGQHDGYRRRAGVTHRRDIIGRADGLAIFDRLLDGGQPREVAIFFLCHPSLTVELKEDGLVLVNSQDGETCRLRAPSGFSVEIPGRAGDPLYFSPRFGVLQETAGILLRGRLDDQPCATTIQIGTAPR